MYIFDPDYSEETENVDRVRDALKDYYGTAMASGFPMAVVDLAKVDSMTDDEVLLIAKKNGIIWDCIG